MHWNFIGGVHAAQRTLPEKQFAHAQSYRGCDHEMILLATAFSREKQKAQITGQSKR
jgi:hypothetical protein